jgi:hypothetical protein
MFWNDPNLYSVAFKDIPNVPFGPFATTQRIPFGMTQPYLPPQFPPYTPYLHTPTFNPFVPQVTPQIPQFTPYQQFNAFTPYLQPHTMTPYNWTMPLYNFYRPFVF